MPSSYIVLALVVGTGLISCSRRDTPRRQEPVAREVGREAYSAGQDIKRGAKKAAQEVRKAGKEFREGWAERRNETRNEPPPKKK